MQKTVLLVVVLLGSVGPLLAGEEIAVGGREQQAVSVTIYTKNLALVKDRRTIDLPKGVRTLAFREVSAQIRPETAVMQGRDLAVLEQNFEYDLLTPQSLLRKYVGREVTMSRRHPATGEDLSVQARVLSAGDGVVLQVGNRIETEVSGRLVYPDVPDTLRDRPTLTMLVDSGAEGPREVELTYLTAGLSWRADYVAELNAADDRLDLSGWVTLTNESGARYPQARLQLVAGDVNVVQRSPEPRATRLEATLAMAPAAKAMAEEPMFEYHLYSLERPTTIGENQKKQVALLQAGGVACRKEYLLRGQEYYFSARAGEIGRKMNVGVFVELKNEKEGGLGQPLPGGVVRVYKKDSGGFLQFVGEDAIDHTPEKELVRLRLGDAFDITADKVQTDFKQLKREEGEPAGSLCESEYAIRVKNAKKEAVTVKVQEPIPGDWQILSESGRHVKEAANLASWMVTVPPMETATLTYRVRVRN